MSERLFMNKELVNFLTCFDGNDSKNFGWLVGVATDRSPRYF